MSGRGLEGGGATGGPSRWLGGLPMKLRRSLTVIGIARGAFGEADAILGALDLEVGRICILAGRRSFGLGVVDEDPAAGVAFGGSAGKALVGGGCGGGK